MPIEFGRTFIDRIDNDGTSPELASPSHATSESVDEQVTAEVVPLFDPFDGKAREQYNRHRVGHSRRSGESAPSCSTALMASA